MARLIDADALIGLLNNAAYDDWNQGVSTTWANAYSEIADMISNQPTIDAVPVVHGRWIVDEDPHDGDVRCSCCLTCIDALHERNWPMLTALGYTLQSYYKYCPNCGAKMDGSDNE